jgi:putative oxidoreductase
MTTDSSYAADETKKGFTRFLPAIARVLLGLPLTVFGLNLFLNFIPEPKMEMPAAVMAFVGALKNSGYMMQLIGATQLIVGILLLTNRFVPLALALFAPFIVNSFAFHVFLEPSGLPMTCIFVALEVYLAWCYRDAYRPMLAAKVRPA